jgi:hypothetical protein
LNSLRFKPASLTFPRQLRFQNGTSSLANRFPDAGNYEEEAKMPVLLLWAIPAVVVIGGGGYWLMHLH